MRLPQQSFEFGGNEVRVLAVLALLAMFATPALAMTGPINGTPGNYELIENPFDIVTLAGVTANHNETVNNPQQWFKGWYLATITNKSGVDWTGMLIQAQGNGVYIVQGTDLVDEWGFTGDSVISNKAANTITYSGDHGPVSYTAGGSGELYDQVYFAFAAPLAANQKVSFRIYTDNTAYSNGSFGLLFTPTAVPEPSAMLAIVTGLIGLAGFTTRRRK
jgi:hypothetical protein